MNSKCLLIALFIIVTQACFSQTENETIYTYNADWSVSHLFDKCTYFMYEIKNNDTEYVCRYYNKFGPMLRQEVYKDSALSIGNGLFCWYNKKGKLDSCGYMINSKRDGEWRVFSGDSINPSYLDRYKNGEYLYRQTFENFMNDSVRHQIESTKRKASFGNFPEDWFYYVNDNVSIPSWLYSKFKKGKYFITVGFTINKIGRPVNVYLIKSIEWSLDKEVFAIIHDSPRWNPAMFKNKYIADNVIKDILVGEIH